MNNVKKWISYSSLLEHPELYGVKIPKSIPVVYKPEYDGYQILNSISLLNETDLALLNRILREENKLIYYPIGEYKGQIYLTTDKVAILDRGFFSSNFPKPSNFPERISEMLSVYAKCHGNTDLKAVGYEWTGMYTPELLSVMPYFLKKLPTAFWTSIRFTKSEDDFIEVRGLKAVISGRLHEIPITVKKGNHLIDETNWGISFRPLVVLPRDILVSSDDLYDGRNLHLKLPTAPFWR